MCIAIQVSPCCKIFIHFLCCISLFILLILQGLSRKSILDKVDLNLFQSSTKIEALMEVLSVFCFLFSVVC